MKKPCAFLSDCNSDNDLMKRELKFVMISVMTMFAMTSMMCVMKNEKCVMMNEKCVTMNEMYARLTLMNAMNEKSPQRNGVAGLSDWRLPRVLQKLADDSSFHCHCDYAADYCEPKSLIEQREGMKGVEEGVGELVR